MLRTYSELSRLSSLEERFEYLRIGGSVGEATFGMERYVNQNFYRSREWKDARRDAIARDNGWDIGAEGTGIRGLYIVHHMNPLTMRDLEEGTDNLLNIEYLITCSKNTHNAIHFGDISLLPQPYVERQPGDTKLSRM